MAKPLREIVPQKHTDMDRANTLRDKALADKEKYFKKQSDSEFKALRKRLKKRK